MPLTLSSPLYTDRSQIEYWELGEYRENWMEDNSNLTRRLACLWGQRFDFMNDMLGNAESIGGLLYRDLPQEDAESPGYYSIGGTLVQGAGYPGRHADHSAVYFKDRSVLDDDDEPSDGFAIYDITYTKPIYDLKDDADAHESDLGELCRFVIREREFNAEALPMPSRFLEWELPPRQQIPQAAPIVFPKGIYYYTWKMVPEEAWDEDTALSIQGTVNKYEFDNRFPAETLLFMGPKVRRYQHGNGTIYLDITYVFEYKRQKHNKFLRADRANAEPEFEYVRRIQNPSERVFLKEDFQTQLFTVL